MDSLSTIGVVASVIQLAGAALSLSKALSSLRSDTGTACVDIHALADELKTFSQSLNLLSRLLEDSISSYSDDIYLLTAKIIKDCAEIYVKIDKVLVKSGEKAKRTWKNKVKVVHKEGQIRKLLTRLKVMNGTLATILMSLQVDSQLSLLNIPSSSRIQRTPERLLQAETIQIFKDAKVTLDSSEVILRYNIQSGQFIEDSERRIQISSTDKEQTTDYPALKSFVTLPSLAPESNLKEVQNPVAGQLSFQLAGNKTKPVSTNGLKSLPSVESSSSASSYLETKHAILEEINAIQGVLHAFRTALETLEILVCKRIEISEKDDPFYVAAKGLQKSLEKGEKTAEDVYRSHYLTYGKIYVESIAKFYQTELDKIGSILFEKVILVLLTQSGKHITLRPANLDFLNYESEACRHQVVSTLDEAASTLKPEGCSPINTYTTARSANELRSTIPGASERFRQRRREKEETFTSEIEGLEKCPFRNCKFHTEGFVKQYDRDRHIITHFQGELRCGFCPQGQTFQGVDIMKLHLISMHGVKQTLRNNEPVMTSENERNIFSECDFCMDFCGNALNFYMHIDECVLRFRGNPEFVEDPCHSEDDSLGSLCLPIHTIPLNNHPVSNRSKKRPSQGDAVLVSLMDGGKRPDIVRRAGQSPLSLEDEQENSMDGSNIDLAAAASTASYLVNRDQSSNSNSERAQLTSLDAVEREDINPKQSHRIQKRRQAREMLQEHLAKQPPKKLQQSLRHARRRPCGPDSRILIAGKIDAREEDMHKEKCHVGAALEVDFLRGDLRDEFLTKVEERIKAIQEPGESSAKRLEHTLSATSIHFLNAPPHVHVCGEARAISDYEKKSENEISLTEGQYFWVSNQCKGSRLIVGNPKTQEIGQVPKEVVHLVTVPSHGLIFAPTELQTPLPYSSKMTLENANSSTCSSPVTDAPDHESGSQVLPAVNQPRPSSSKNGNLEEAIAILCFKTDSKGELPMEKGQTVFILNEGEGGWTYAENSEQTKCGWVPETYIQRVSKKEDEIKPKSKQFAYSHPSSTTLTIQRPGIWWQGYLTLRKHDQSTVFLSLDGTLSHEFGFLTSAHISDKNICSRISTLISRAQSAATNATSSMCTAMEARANIIRIAVVVEQNLGLEVVMLGWACVSVFLAILDPLLTTTHPLPLTESEIRILTSLFLQLHEITGIIARYAIMENLHIQSSISLTLNPDYEASLLSLYVSILEWFSHAFIVSKGLGDVPRALSIPLVYLSSVEHECENSENLCDEMLVQIREKDKMCQAFRVLCVVGDEGDSGTEDENGHAEIEDVSDDSWEVIPNDEFSDDGVKVVDSGEE